MVNAQKKDPVVMIKYKITGYHGTTYDAAQNILKEKQFRHSTRKNDWLGTGSYFFAYKAHAKYWLKNETFKSQKTAILEADFEYTREQLLDLDDPEDFFKLDRTIKKAIANIKTGKNPGPIVNLENSPVDKQWCLACNFYRKLNRSIGIIIYTFPIEPRSIAGFSQTQRQICVSNDDLVVNIKES